MSSSQKSPADEAPDRIKIIKKILLSGHPDNGWVQELSDERVIRYAEALLREKPAKNEIEIVAEHFRAQIEEVNEEIEKFCRDNDTNHAKAKVKARLLLDSMNMKKAMNNLPISPRDIASMTAAVAKSLETWGMTEEQLGAELEKKDPTRWRRGEKENFEAECEASRERMKDVINSPRKLAKRLKEYEYMSVEESEND